MVFSDSDTVFGFSDLTHSLVFVVSHLHGGRIAHVEVLQKLQFHAAASIHGAHKQARAIARAPR
jgi:hypothetical protein